MDPSNQRLIQERQDIGRLDVDTAEKQTMLPNGRTQLDEKEELKKSEDENAVSGTEGFPTNRCWNEKSATAVIALGLLVTMSIARYNNGIVRTLERRFELKSVNSATLSIVVDVVQSVTGGFLAYVGSKSNKLRVLAVTTILTAAGLFINIIPFLMFGPKSVSHSSSVTNDTTSIYTIDQKRSILCQNSSVGGDKLDACSNMSGESLQFNVENKISYGILIAGSIVGGFSSNPYFYLGIPYIEENVRKEDAAIYIGIVMSMLAGSKILGTLLASFTLSFPESLRGSNFSEDESAFIGAWWLGYVILAVACIVVAIPMMSHPKHMPYYYKHVKLAKKEITASKRDRGMSSLLKHAKGIISVIVRLFSNKYFVVAVVVQTLSLYVSVGVLIQLPRYMEIHFHQPANVANIITATTVALSGLVGVMTGSVILKKMGGTQKAMVVLTLIAVVASFVSLIIGTFLSCPEPTLFKQFSNAADSSSGNLYGCNPHCNCDIVEMKQVCDASGTLFLSPCHAGCTVGNFDNSTYSGCSCATTSDKIVSTNLCGFNEMCPSLIPFCVVIFVGSFVAAAGSVPAMLLVLSLVENRDKTLAMSVRSFFINFGTFVLGHVLFGSLIDASCLVWSEECGTTGACKIYDTNLFRYYTYGVTSIFKFASVIFLIVLYILLARKSFVPKT